LLVRVNRIPKHDLRTDRTRERRVLSVFSRVKDYLHQILMNGFFSMSGHW